MSLTHDKQAAAVPQVPQQAKPRQRPRRVQWRVDEALLRRMRALAAQHGRTGGAELEQAILTHLRQHGG